MIKLHYLLSAAITSYIKQGFELRQIDEETSRVYMTRDHENHITITFVWLGERGELIERGQDAGY